MKPRFPRFLAVFPLVFAAAAPGRAQLPNTDLQMVAPAFAKAGETVEVTLTGDHLEEIRGLRFSDTRITAEPATTPADEFFPEPQPAKNRFRVSVPADLPPGIVEVRSLGFFGLSTARPFMILPKDSPEIVESGDHSSRENALPLPIETGVLGIVDAQKVDWFRIEAKKGERLLIQVWAERLDSKLDGMLAVSDAEGRELETSRGHFSRDPLIDFTAPADGTYFVSLTDILYRGGSGSFYRLLVSRKPVVDFVVPPAGEPGKKTKFTLHGRNLPGGSPGEGVQLDGKPLDSVEVEIELPAEAGEVAAFTGATPRQEQLPALEYRLGDSNAVRVGFATAPVVREDPKAAPAQNVTVPCEIAGCFDEPGDADAYRFAAKKGETWWIESISERLLASTDTVLLVRKVGKDEKGVETLAAVAENDDPPTFFSADRHDSTNADTNDAMLSFTADADGDYEVKIVNNLASGGPAHLYRLAIRPAAPDFRLITTTERNITATNGRAGFPAAPLVRRGGSLAYRVIASRRDGFDGDIVVTAEGLPKGVSAPPLTLGGPTGTGYLIVSAAPDAPAWRGPIRIVGKAGINGKDTVRAARNASLVWGVIFSDSFRVRTRFDLETVLSVSADESAPAYVTQADPAKAWEVELNGALEFPVKVADTPARKGNLTVQAYGFPNYLRNPPSVAIPEGKTEGVLKMNFKPDGNFKVEPGRYQFCLQGIGIAKYRYHPAAADAADAERKRLETLAGEFAAAAADAAKLAEAAAKALETAKANAAAATGDSKAEVEKQAADAQAKLEAAKKTAAEAEARSKKAKDLLAAAEITAKAAADKARETDTKFATFSPPITVVVKPPPAEKK
ncbi:MAG: PPC domain-containing protein [Akkermansiaceae bacterium]|nr:PPC domain-containing protein [Akkermansiaceae bacterium]MCP5549459.1 PPC domain-containing protein [Akkermansiaceae bacterium]